MNHQLQLGILHAYPPMGWIDFQVFLGVSQLKKELKKNKVY
jgi:hypothetical protein